MIAFLIVVIACVAGALFMSNQKANNPIDQDVIDEVKFGQLTISVDGDEGQIKPGEFRLIKNQLEGITTIVSMVERGSHVKEGETIIELDSSALKDRKVDQDISVQLADAAFVRSRESLEIIKKQNESNVKIATLNFEFAKQDVKKYLEGEYPQQLRNAKAAIKLSQAEAEDARNVLEWTEKLLAKGYVNQTDLNRDKLARDRKKIELEAAEGSLDLLENYTHKRALAQLEADVDAAELAFVLAKHRANSNLIDSKADLKAKEIRLKREQEKLAKLDEQIEKATIRAPIDGQVLYIDNKRDENGGLSVGSRVYERQWLVHLPTTGKLIAELKIHESQLGKIKLDMPVEITTDAVPNKVFWGKLAKIAEMPDPTVRYGNPYLKVYTTNVEFTGDNDGLRPGMSCKGRVIVEQFDQVAYVPIQAVVQENDESVVYVPGKNGPERRQVKVGMDNNVHIIVNEGLAQGDKILMAPTLSNSYVRTKQGPPVVPDSVKAASVQPKPEKVKTDTAQNKKPIDELKTGKKETLSRKPRNGDS